MNKTSTLNSILAAGALAALCVYILACRPAFSPDGSQVLFPSVDPQTTNFAVTCYNLVTRQAEVVFTVSLAKGTPILAPQWTADGKRAVIAMGGMDDDALLRIAVLPLRGKGPTRFFEVVGPKENAAGLMIPPPLIGQHLYVGGKSLIRLNLETGELKAAETDGELYLHQQGDQLYYWGELNEGEKGFELGRLDRETLDREPILRLIKEEVGDVSAFISFARDGSRLALTREKENQSALLIVSGPKIAQTLLVGSTNDPVKLGNTQWSPTGKMVYAASLRKSAATNQLELGVTEIPLDGSAPRHTPLIPVAEDDDGAVLAFQIALAPDGKTIAASSTYLDLDGKGKIKETDRALFLIDLDNPQRQVTKIPIPAPAKSPTK